MLKKVFASGRDSGPEVDHLLRVFTPNLLAELSRHSSWRHGLIGEIKRRLSSVDNATQGVTSFGRRVHIPVKPLFRSLCVCESEITCLTGKQRNGSLWQVVLESFMTDCR